MSASRYDVCAIGDALVDVLSHASEDFLAEQTAKLGVIKGTMLLINEAQATELYDSMGPAVEVSGGSAANTIAGLASFGGKGAFIGKVADDQLGQVFRHDLKAQGAEFRTPPLVGGPATGRCLILVTPDGQRTMNTYLGAATVFDTGDVDAEIIGASQVTYLEGYLFDLAPAKAAFRAAAKIAHDAGQRVALTLSDPFCVDRHRADFLDLVENHIDILFANEDEIKSLYQVESFEEAVKAVAHKCEIAALTRSEKGAVIVSGDQVINVAAAPVSQVVDTTGAGDQYAAGFLYGFTQGHDLAACGRLGALSAAEVIQHMGPRPEMDYKELIAQAA